MVCGHQLGSGIRCGISKHRLLSMSTLCIFLLLSGGLVGPPVSGVPQVGVKSSVSGSPLAVSSGAVRYADQFPGGDAGARIQAAINDLPSTGGTVDARGLAGVQTISTDFGAGLTKSVRLLWGATTFKVKVSISVPRKMDWIGAGMDQTLFDYVGPGQFIKGTGRWSEQTFRDFRATLAGNAQTGVSFIDAQEGAGRCLFENIYLRTNASAGENGIVIRGVDPQSGRANADQFNNLFININTYSAQGEASGAALSFLGRPVEGGRVNANRVLGGVFDGFATGILIHSGNTNTIINPYFNGPDSKAAILIRGGSETFGNMIIEPGVDSAVRGAKIVLGDTQTVRNPVYKATIVAGLSLINPSDVTVQENVPGNVRYSMLGRSVFIGGSASRLNDDDGAIVRSIQDQGLLNVRAGSNRAGGLLLLSGVGYTGGVNAVSDHGGVSVSVQDSPVAQFRIVKTANGYNFAKLAWVDSSGNAIFTGFVASKAAAFAALANCDGNLDGAMRAVTDSTTAAWGATISGGGRNHVLAYCDGRHWTVAAK